MTRPSPSPTLFPYTTLFRSLPEALIVNPYNVDQCAGALKAALTMPPAEQRDRMRSMRGRSEEHTSELQSHSDLVCRLLLEKKKTTGRRCRRDRPRPSSQRSG